MAWDELRSLCAMQLKSGADAGMIPHMAYWKGGGTELWGVDDRSTITQPPLIASMAYRIARTANDPEPLRELYPALCAYHEWFDRRRDPDGDHLVTLIHPWESGWDASQRWDLPMGLNRPTPEQSKAARHGLVAVLQAHDYDVNSLLAQGSFCVEASEFNAIRAADLEALAKIGAWIGEPDANRWQQKASDVQGAIRQKMLRRDAAGELQICELNGEAETPIFAKSGSQFVLLFGGVPNKEEADELLRRLLTPAFWTPYPISTTAVDHPDFAPDQYWRGNVWLSLNWLVYAGLRRYGYDDTAKHISEYSAELVEKNGFHEYFNPLDGTGYGPDQQSWTTLVLDMLISDQSPD
jgi:glycogen debranching enzyme